MKHSSKDYEWLILAAELSGFAPPHAYLRTTRTLVWYSKDGGPIHAEWRPLDNNADALELFCKLPSGLRIETSDVGVSIHERENFGSINVKFTEYFAGHGGDKEQALRRVIVRAAAYFGREKP